MLNSISRTDLLIIIFEIFYEILLLYYTGKIWRELKKLEEEEMIRMIKKQYEKRDN
jgi:hypothetical protein